MRHECIFFFAMTARPRPPRQLTEWLHEAGEEDAVSRTPRTYFRRAGTEAAPAPAPAATASTGAAPAKAAPAASAPRPEPRQAAPGPAVSHEAAIRKAQTLAAACDTVEALEEAVRAFDGIALKKFATNTVFSDGSRKARIMLIGEAPGANEDEQGIPFCGASGKLLDKMLAAIGLDRNTVYITNTLFWRPPGNRTPTREELEICEPFVKRHIELMAPRLMIFCGGTSATFLLRSKVGITKLRGRLHHYATAEGAETTPVAILFHPSYLLRSPAQKKLAWHDLLLIKEHIEQQHILDT